ncbi:MAG TPA: hypothetical protein PK205_04570 [Promineifilum sp.]|nr:hypothetical protein [Promineifilum sp.]HRO88915.1 hypothetical protein [Promineifilum sp.]HRQ12559.1 hypothetical protein [Promineifilum sp.]
MQPDNAVVMADLRAFAFVLARNLLTGLLSLMVISLQYQLEQGLLIVLRRILP